MNIRVLFCVLSFCLIAEFGSAQRLTIHSTSWKLKEHLVGIDPLQYQELRIVGSLNYDDMELIARKFRHIRVLDLSKATVGIGYWIVTGNYDVKTQVSTYGLDTVAHHLANTMPEGSVFWRMNVEEFMFPQDIVAVKSPIGFQSLKKLPKLPASLKELSSYAFAGNLCMEGTIKFPKQIEVIEHGAFSNCPLLRGIVKVPVSLDMYRSAGFLNGCTGLDGVCLPKRYPFVAEGGFIMTQDRKTLLSGTIPARRIVHLPAVEEIYESVCRSDKEVREVVCAPGLKRIGKFAFSECCALNKIMLPEGLEEIGHYAFSGCDFDEITIPSTVRKIGASRWLETKRLIVKSPIPCELEESGNPNENLIIIVPKGAKEAYEQAVGWRVFQIVE